MPYINPTTDKEGYLGQSSKRWFELNTYLMHSGRICFCNSYDDFDYANYFMRYYPEIVVLASFTMTGNQTVQGRLSFVNGAKIKPNGYTLTITAAFNPGEIQVFNMAGGGTISFSDTLYYLSSRWFSTGDTAAQTIFNTGNVVLWKKADGTFTYKSDLTVSTAGKGLVLTNAGGTVTKRVRLNDAGDGLIYETP